MNHTFEGSELPISSRKSGSTVGWDPYEVWRTRVRVQRTKQDGAAMLQDPTDARVAQPAREKAP